MNILIIGSSGFIGSNAVAYFHGKGVNVFSSDIFSEELSNHNFFLLNDKDPDFDSLFSTQKYDLCINASGAATVNYSITNPMLDHRLNVMNVFKILEAIRVNNPACKFLNFSSAAVYGNPQVLPVAENSSFNPLSPYGYHKLIAEKVCEEYFKLFGIPTCSLRVFSAYGPKLKKQLFWDVYKKTNSGKVIEMHGTGKETRDFIYIEDLMQAIDIIVQSNLFQGNVFNVSSGIETTIEHAVRKFLDIIKPEAVIKFNGITREGDPINWRADISLIKSYGFFPKVELVSGLNKYWQWLNSI